MIAQEAQYRDWMLAALMGDAGAYRKLLQGLTRHLRSYYARRLDAAAAEDAVQETLIAIHARRATYDPSQPFTAWVYGIARYKLIDEFRRAKRRPTVPLEDAGELFGDVVVVDGHGQIHQGLDDALIQLAQHLGQRVGGGLISGIGGHRLAVVFVRVELVELGERKSQRAGLHRFTQQPLHLGELGLGGQAITGVLGGAHDKHHQRVQRNVAADVDALV